MTLSFRVNKKNIGGQRIRKSIMYLSTVLHHHQSIYQLLNHMSVRITEYAKKGKLEDAGVQILITERYMRRRES